VKGRPSPIGAVGPGRKLLSFAALAGACFKSLTDKWADTTTPHGRLPRCTTGVPSRSDMPS
jgi:hypothetical protein